MGSQHQPGGCPPYKLYRPYQSLLTRQCCVITLNVEFEMIHEVVLPQEADSGGCIPVVLVLGGLLRFGLQQEGAFEPELLLEGHSHLEEPAGRGTGVRCSN